jgi:oxygen-dependent protoporphyrinogen oxidase
VVPNRVIIIGGGISGLSAAHFLAQQGVRSTIIEKSDRLGGLIQTDRIEGCELEAGPDSWIAAKASVRELAADLGDLSTQIIGSNDSERKIFIVHKGRLTSFPQGMAMMVPGKWGPVLRSSLFSVGTKLNFLGEVFQKPRARAEDVSIAQFIGDHFGRQVLDTIAEPLLSGVYGGDAGQLSASSVLPRFLQYERDYGSLIRGVRKEQKAKSSESLFLSFRGGMQALIDGLKRATADAVDVWQGEVRAVERSGDRWRVKIAEDWIAADQIVMACPAHTAARFLENDIPSLASDLAGIPYSSAILVMLVYRKSEIRHSLDGFGFLVPRNERRGVAAATWVNTKFPSRVRPDLVALRAFLVDRDAAERMTMADHELVAVAQSEFQRLMGITAVPIFDTVHRLPQSMPQYVVGHAGRNARIQAALHHLRGLYLIGNAYDGVGIPDCIRLAKNMMKRLTVAMAQSI